MLLTAAKWFKTLVDKSLILNKNADDVGLQGDIHERNSINLLTELYAIRYHFLAMSDRLPILIDLEYLIAKQSELGGRLSLSEFSRLSEFLTADQGDVDITISFYKEGDIKTVLGKVCAQLFLQCQRCLKPVSLTVDRQFRLGLVKSDEQARRLPKLYEPFLIDGEPVVLSELIEDELILAIPDIPKHNECQLEQMTFGKIDIEEQAEPNPFAILAKLKSKEN